MKDDRVCKEATIEGLIMQLKLEREANIALLKRIEDDEKPVSGDLYKEIVKVIIDEAVNQKREWVGLTVEEIDDIWKTEVFDVHYGIARMVEAKLKEKNCG